MLICFDCGSIYTTKDEFCLCGTQTNRQEKSKCQSI